MTLQQCTERLVQEAVALKSADNVAAGKGHEGLDNGDGCGYAEGGLRVRQDDL